jgi:hypothetical protein
MGDPVHACLLIDDPPANGTYWARLQQLAMGYVPGERGGWGTKWRDLEPAAWFRVVDARAFADLIEEFGVRGKFTFLPCPAGLGRIDEHVRGYPDDLRELVSIVRDRIGRQFDIAPEVLTHSMALDIETMGLLPHAESAWITHHCVTGNVEPLRRYLRHGFGILRNAGFTPRGLTIGGMDDVSNIAQGRQLWRGDGAEVLAEVLLWVEREFDAAVRTTFVFLGMAPRGETSRRRRAPSLLYEAPDGGRVFTIHSASEDVVFPVMHGPGGRVAEVTDALITRDLAEGLLVREAESGRAVVFAAHAQTLNAMNSGAGIEILREALRRFHARYGSRIVWQTGVELCERLGTRV